MGSIEGHRLQQYGNAIIVDAYSLLLLLTDSAEYESMPLEWIEEVATDFTIHCPRAGPGPLGPRVGPARP